TEFERANGIRLPPTTAPRRGLSIKEGQPFVTRIDVEVSSPPIHVKVQATRRDDPHTSLTSCLFVHRRKKTKSAMGRWVGRPPERADTQNAGLISPAFVRAGGRP